MVTPRGVEMYRFSAWLFLRGLGVVFGVAFVSLWTQLAGLFGENGILPAKHYFQMAVARTDWWELPSVFRVNASDAALHGVCAAGVVLSGLLVAGVAPKFTLALLWLAYLSLSIAGQVFFGFQWDVLLLETALVAIILAPSSIRPRGPVIPSAAGVWLVRALLFKLMFLSGITKLLSGGPTWRDWTALDYHFWTQPLPAWTAWYADGLPGWMHTVSLFVMYVIELGVPFLIFTPRVPRRIGGLLLIGLQVVIAATGSYGFFNLLTALLCVPLLDDAFLERLVPRRWRPKKPIAVPFVAPAWKLRVAWAFAIPLLILSGQRLLGEMTRTAAMDPHRMPGTGLLDRLDRMIVRPTDPLVRWTRPFRSINGYGLFRVMTTERPEIIVEGSNDGFVWEAYELPWKPGDVTRRPRFNAPHQPRLDWQLWFAGLDPAGNGAWLQSLCRRVLEGSEPVLGLFDHNPFPDDPPRYVRLHMYHYTFTDRAEKRATGAWWVRESDGPVTRVMSRPD